MDVLLQYGLFLVLLVVGLTAGTIAERRHYRRLRIDEFNLKGVLVFNERRLPDDLPVERAKLVVGSVVIGEDYFKRVAASLKSLVGGRLTVYESLMDRGRREAVVRMKRAAKQLGADMVFNVRFETASLSEDRGGQRAAFSAEFFAYGTAIVAKRAA